MWFAIALLGVSIGGMLLLMPKTKIENARASSLNDLDFPRSNEGDPLPIGKGTYKLSSPNTLYMGGFRTQAITKKVKTGLFSSKKQITGYKYYITIDLGLVLGPNTKLLRIWMGDKVLWRGIAGANRFKIQVWKDGNYRNKMLEFTDAVYNLKDIGLNDGISSIKATGKWEIFEHANFEGRSMVVEGNIADLVNTEFQDIVSSMRPVWDSVDLEGIADSVFRIKDDNFHGTEGQGGVEGEVAFYSGGHEQSIDSFIQQQLGTGDTYPNYNGLSHFVMRDFYIGNSASIGALAFEMQTFSNRLGLPDGKNIMRNGLDENPIETLYDLYISREGKLGFPTGNIPIENWREVALKVWDENIGCSLLVTSTQTGKDLSREILRLVNGILYTDTSTGETRIKLIRQDYDVKKLPIVSPSNVSEITDFDKGLWDDTVNQVRVKYTDRANNYANGSAQWQDFANINFQNRVRSSDISMPLIYEGELANRIAVREASQLSVPLYKATVQGNRENSSISPGDPFLLVWPQFDTPPVVMRAKKVSSGTDSDGKVTIGCVQDEFTSLAVTYAAPEPSLWSPTDTSPRDIAKRAVFATPKFFLDRLGITSGERLWALAQKRGQQSMAYDIRINQSGSEYADSGEQTSFAGAASLVTLYPATAGSLTGEDAVGFAITGLDSAYIPESSNVTAMREGSNLIYVNGEIMAYEGVSVDSGNMRLTGVRRGLLDTVAMEHPAQSTVFFLSHVDGVSDTTLSASDTVRVKLQERTPAGVLDLASATVLGPVQMDSRSLRPLQPTLVTCGGARTGTITKSASVAVAWRCRSNEDPNIRFQNDPSSAIPAGVSFLLRYRFNTSAWTEVAVTALTTNLDLSALTSGTSVSLEVYAVKNGLRSRVAATCNVVIA